MGVRRPTPRPRRGLASLEAVITTAVAVPAAVGLLAIGLRMCKILYGTVVALVEWPYP